jgi:thioredoxin-related protein
MNINAYPTLIFLDENLQPITNLMGKFTAKELEPYLSMIATNQYKSIKTRDQWENYQKKFKSKIKRVI